MAFSCIAHPAAASMRRAALSRRALERGVTLELSPVPPVGSLSGPAPRSSRCSPHRHRWKIGDRFRLRIHHRAVEQCFPGPILHTGDGSTNPNV